MSDTAIHECTPKRHDVQFNDGHKKCTICGKKLNVIQNVEGYF